MSVITRHITRATNVIGPNFSKLPFLLILQGVSKILTQILQSYLSYLSYSYYQGSQFFSNPDFTKLPSLPFLLTFTAMKFRTLNLILPFLPIILILWGLPFFKSTFFSNITFRTLHYLFYLSQILPISSHYSRSTFPPYWSPIASPTRPATMSLIS